VDGLQGTPYRPAVLAAGMAWPAVSTRRRINSCAASVTWYAYVALASNEQSAAELADTLEWDVEDALTRLGTHLATDRIVLPTAQGSSSFYCLRITFEATAERPSR
jgi:hypothetical protein